MSSDGAITTSDETPLALKQGPLRRLLRTPQWSTFPGQLAFVWCLLNLLLFGALIVLGDTGARGVAAEIGLWVPLSLAAARVMPSRLGPLSYLSAVAALALIEETIAYMTGGGLHGTATSLPMDWVRAVPTFEGLGAGLLVASRWSGLSPSEMFSAAAIAGVVIEIGLGSRFNPVVLLALSGAVAWVYGSILALPFEPRSLRGPRWVRYAVTAALMATGAVLGGFLGIGLQSALRL